MEPLANPEIGDSVSAAGLTYWATHTLMANPPYQCTTCKCYNSMQRNVENVAIVANLNTVVKVHWRRRAYCLGGSVHRWDWELCYFYARWIWWWWGEALRVQHGIGMMMCLGASRKVCWLVVWFIIVSQQESSSQGWGCPHEVIRYLCWIMKPERRVHLPSTPNHAIFSGETCPWDPNSNKSLIIFTLKLRDRFSRLLVHLLL